MPIHDTFLNTWRNPLPLRLVPVSHADSFGSLPPGSTGTPLAPHPGSFGFVRRHHTHEGVDLYAPDGTQVSAVESGVVVRIEAFTGPLADTPWWEDTQAIFVEGASGVVVYGELSVAAGLMEGDHVMAGRVLGSLLPVLRNDKGRPMTMLHIELHEHGARSAPAWEVDRPVTLQDPTPYLLACVNRNCL